LQDVVSNEVCLVGTYGFDRSDFASAVRVLPDVKSELSTFIEGRCRLSETPQVMTSLARGESQALKTVIVFED
jgi:threonine dehydrogenase-like Zn-dependent dehydrogenase